MTRIVILGAGFGGIYTYLSLKKHIKNFDTAEIVLVDKKNYFLFVPMIHEVATGSLEPTSVIQPIRQAINAKVVQFIEGEVDEIDLDGQTVKIRLVDVLKNIKYDYLVLAMGSTNNFFGTPGAEYAMTLKDLNDAQKIKRQVIESFERANQMKDCEQRERLLNFVIIGGGPTGVELAGEMADLINHEIKQAYPSVYKKCHVHLVQSGDKLLLPVDPWFGQKSKKILEAMHVRLHFNTKVTSISSKGVETDSGEQIASSNVFWTAGVKAQAVNLTGHKSAQIVYDERSGRIKVLPTLQTENLANVFVVGDQMWLGDKETNQAYPMRAQFASREGTVAGENIVRLINKQPLKEFHWRDQGFIVSLGKGGALAQVGKFKFSGPLAWWLYRTAYLMKLVGTRAKFKTAYEWTINLFLPRDISKF